MHKSDKYKNCRESNDPKYSDVLPLVEYAPNKGNYSVAIFDPPYSSQVGGHTATNCNLKNSEGSIKFNQAYGTTMLYSTSMILSLLLEGMEAAAEYIMSGGFLLVKCKDYSGIPYTNEVIRFAREKGTLMFWDTCIFSTKDKVIRKSKDISTMIVFRKVSAKEMDTVEAKCATMSPDEIVEQAKEDYQTKALEKSKEVADLKQGIAELLVHVAELYESYDDFKSFVKERYNFSEKQLADFLCKNNMHTKKLFKRNKGNGVVLRAKRGMEREDKKQRKLNFK